MEARRCFYIHVLRNGCEFPAETEGRRVLLRKFYRIRVFAGQFFSAVSQKTHATAVPARPVSPDDAIFFHDLPKRFRKICGKVFFTKGKRQYTLK